MPGSLPIGLSRMLGQSRAAAPAVPSGPQLAMPVANPGARGQNMRYYLGNLQRLPDNTYTDGIYRYDSNGLSLDRIDQPVPGLPPADWGDRWDVWRAPSMGGASAPPGPTSPAGAPGMPGFPTAPVSLPSFGSSPMQLQAPSALINRLAELLPRPGPSPGLLSRLPPEEAAQVPPGETIPLVGGGPSAIAYQGAPSLAELLKVALARRRGPRAF